MAHTFHGKKANIHFNSMFDKDSYITIIDKITGQKIEIDVDDLLEFINQEYLIPDLKRTFGKG